MKIDPWNFQVHEGDKVHLDQRPTLVQRVFRSKTKYQQLLEEQVAELSAASLCIQSPRGAADLSGDANSRKESEVELSVTLYGIRNCDTMKKARSWLDAHAVDYVFHDYKIDGIDRARLEQWCGELGWEALLNRAGTTFRKLPETDKQSLDARKAVALMLAHPSLVRRPVLEADGHLLVGFKPELYAGGVAAVSGRPSGS